MRTPKNLALASLLFLIFACAVVLGYRVGPQWYLNLAAPLPTDFHVYWTACTRLTEGSSIYRPEDASPYKYSLIFTYLFRYTFFLLSERAAAGLWAFLSVIAYFLALASLARALLAPGKLSGRVLLAGALGLLLSWRGFLETLAYGQADLLLVAAYLAVAASYLKPDAQAGSRAASRVGLWALVLLLKPHFGLALLATAPLARRKEFLFTLLAAGGAYALPTLWLGPLRTAELLGDWLRCLRVQQDVAFLTAQINQGLAATASRLSGHLGWVGPLTAGTIAAYLGLLAWLTARKLRSRAPELSTPNNPELLSWLGLGLSAYLVASPLSWRWLLVAWPPLAMLLAAAAPRVSWLFPWLAFALITQSVLARTLGLNSDHLSYYGLYAGGSLALFLAFTALLFRATKKRA